MISPDGGQVAVAAYAGTVDVFDVRSHRRLAPPARRREQPHRSSRFSRDGRLLLTGSQAAAYALFSARDLQPLGPGASLAHGGHRLHRRRQPGRPHARDGRHRRAGPAVGRREPPADRAPRCPDPRTSTPSAHFAPDGAHVYAVFANGRGYRWDVRPSSWERQACTVAGRRLTRAEWHDALPDRPYKPAC